MPPVLPIEVQTRLLSGNDTPHPGAMIAFLLDQATISALAAACAPLAVAPDHVTLLYLAEDASALAPAKNALVAAVAAVSARQAPITGAINGYGKFVGDDGGYALYVNIDCAELPHFRERLCEAACAAGCELPEDHGFTPHATLAYLGANVAMPDLDIPALPLTFDRIALIWGAEVFTFPLTPAPPETPAMPYVYIERPDDYRAIRAYCDRAAGKDTPGSPIPFVAGTEGIKRDGLDLRMSGARLENYAQNPVVLWGHDYLGQRLPIGRAETRIDGPRLMADVTFDQEDEFARQVESKYRRGFLNTVSLGWKPLRVSGRTMVEWEVLDISAVPVPGDADALMLRQLRALQIDRDAPALPDWPTVAAEMAALYAYPLERPIRLWRTTYHALCRDYERLGKEPPERLAPDYLAALDSEALRGLFLEDEATLAAELFQARADAALPSLPPAMRAALTELRDLATRLLAPPTTDDPPTTDAPPAIDPALARFATLVGVHHGTDG